MSFPAPWTVLHPPSNAIDGSTNVAASTSAINRFMVAPSREHECQARDARVPRRELHAACHEEASWIQWVGDDYPHGSCNAGGSGTAAFTRASVLCGHPLFRNALKDLADAVILARLVEKKIGPERKALGAVLREGIVGENDHLRLGRAMRDERA